MLCGALWRVGLLHGTICGVQKDTTTFANIIGALTSRENHDEEQK